MILSSLLEEYLRTALRGCRGRKDRKRKLRLFMLGGVIYKISASSGSAVASATSRIWLVEIFLSVSPFDLKALDSIA